MKVEIDADNKMSKLLIEYRDTDEGIEEAKMTILHKLTENSWDGKVFPLTQKTLDDLRSALFGLEFIRPGEDDDED
jgi:hypothetical protein